VDERRKTRDKMTRGDDKRARSEKEVPEDLTSASNQEKRTLRKVVAFSKQPAEVDPIEDTTQKTPQAPQVPQKKAPALATRKYEVLGRSQQDYTILAGQEREPSESTFRLLPMAKTVSVPKDKRGTAGTPATPKIIGITHVSAFSGLKDHAGYTEFRYARGFPTAPRKRHGHQLSMLIDAGSGIWVMSGEVAGEFNIVWKHADWTMITSDRNWSDLLKVAQSVPVNIDGIVIPTVILFANSGSEQGILGPPWETYTRNCERNLHDGSSEITIPAVDGSEQVTSVAAIPGDRRDRVASSLEDVYV